MFGANRGVLAYVLKREWALQRKKYDFELEICVIERGGRAARCMGSVPVADLLASEARRPSARVARQVAGGTRTETLPYAFSRPVDRALMRALATPSN